MLKEFKEFAMRGSVLDMAVGIIIGAAFGKIITSFVGDILMPPIGLILGKVDFSGLFLNISGKSYDSLAAAKAAGAATINYGPFLNAVVDFLIVAFVIFLLVRQVNRWKTPAPAPAPKTKDCAHCFTAIPIQATRCPNCTSELSAG
jgi:large conductance mechanosensitive channel